MSLEDRIGAYIEKLEGIEQEKDNLKGDFYLQSKIEAHLEMLCMLTFMDALEKMKKRKNEKG